ncbi:hypothetical protein [Mycolicibacterium fortuitum]|uniref:Transmembrane protein n=1 Tax=Mycolicibacterium fortuitum subsp. fortuitum DSM 46621 = ATCC 6841 = JCM 6387 TaxID=1214102 RepID=K0UWH7_MYCFO|nr:hypothetical protein [Mycolicibacterium fortuitum]AJR30074.1 hypothetical protein G155_13200 [Mycobacterium sp. VKM Ac-1817D]CRL82711.1 hypothetical protein CPGR_05938 [Mycolicibacter nonchromogenicus]EJZ09400.1 hypothetical protein MFORT_22520 [Mycolicibacterium fortuitum subsp. fortuitum DSM 46621 = ATCC 6841 = JCM 6387]MCA4723626.1 hypothetical protein [Mycolicibacterium fortuitum]OBB29334.1 hypothetical protein A5763_15615 [Mycolicibacterium fortuitum]
MTGDTTQSATWQNTLPHFSTVEKHGHITMPVPQPSETLRFFAVVTFILWIPVAVGAAFWIHSMQTQDPSIWIGIAAIVGSFLPAILSGIVADEARDTFGQRSTGNRVALIPALAGVAVGLLGSAVWISGGIGGVLALVSMACSAGAALATVAAWQGIRYTRRRRDWLVNLRRHGVRSPGELRNVEFKQRWTADDPQFTVTVAFESPTGRRVVTANMVAHHARVPLAGSRVVVFSAPHDMSDDVLIELDPDDPPKFDRDPSGRYRKPSGN